MCVASSPSYGISSTQAPLVMGGRSPMASLTVTVRSGAPACCGTAVYCAAGQGAAPQHVSPASLMHAASILLRCAEDVHALPATSAHAFSPCTT